MGNLRGSEKLWSAWNRRTLSEEAFKEIAAGFEDSPALIEKAKVAGGHQATGFALSASYTGDEIPRCGNDLANWLSWLRKHGGGVRPPKIIINGTPDPDTITFELAYGDVREFDQELEVGPRIRPGGQFDRLQGK